MASATPPTRAPHRKDSAVWLQHGARTCLMAAKPERRGAGRGQDFRIAHLTLGVFLMMHGLQQSVTQAVRRYHFFVHGLPPRQGISTLHPHESEEAQGFRVGSNLS